MNTLRTCCAPLLAALCVASLPATGCATAEDSLDLADGSAEVGVRGRFDLYQADGAYYFDLLSGNGRLLLASQAYTSRTDALGGLLSVLRNGALAERYRVVTDADGAPYLELRAGNHEVIATSDVYASVYNAERGIETCVGAVQGYIQHWADYSGARFEVFLGANSRHYFRLYARNGEQVLGSQAYASKAAALNGAFAVAEYGTDPAAYDVRSSSDGGYYLVLRAPNNEVIASSEVYSSEASALRARDALIALLPTIQLL